MKLDFKTIDEVMNFAIDQENESSIFYELLAEKVEEQWMKTMLKDMAAEEIRHKEKLEDILLNKRNHLTFSGKIDYLGISDTFKDVDPFSMKNIGYKDALIIAMKNEEAALKLYLSLAQIAESKEIQDTFLTLAREEGKHKMHFETEYAQNKKAGFIT